MRIIPIILLFLLIQCNDDKGCKNAICTEIFVCVQTKITDTTNQQLIGVSTESVLKSNGKIIHSQLGSDEFNQGNFTVVDDNDLKSLGFNNSQEVELRIFKDKKLIKSAFYMIKTDCCHVSKVSGLEVVSLN